MDYAACDSRSYFGTSFQPTGQGFQLVCPMVEPQLIGCAVVVLLLVTKHGKRSFSL